MPSTSDVARPALPASGRPAVSDRPYAAIGLICLAMGIFSIMDGIAKLLTAELSPAEIAWVRFVFLLVFLAPFVLRRGRLRTSRPGLQVARGFCMLGSSVFFIDGLKHLPIADATSIGFVSPLFVTALSIPILGEHVGIRRWSAVLVGFVGILLLVRPGSASFAVEALYPVASAACWAVGLIITRLMHSSDHPFTTIAWSTAVGAAALLPVVPLTWETPSALALALIALAAALSLVAQFCLVSAFRFAPASLLAPFSYSQIVWSTLIGLGLFATLPDANTWAGAAIVVASGLYILHRERIVRRRSAVR